MDMKLNDGDLILKEKISLNSMTQQVQKEE